MINPYENLTYNQLIKILDQEIKDLKGQVFDLKQLVLKFDSAEKDIERLKDRIKLLENQNLKK